MNTLGKYRVFQEIGRGAMGAVYRGHDPFLDRPVAIKVAHGVRVRDDSHGELYRGLFFNEMRTASLLHHPGIVEIYDAGVDGEHYYIAMEHVDGGRSLEHFCRREQLMPIERAAETIARCAEALDYAHRKGVIHRDIKPSNILVSSSGDVKLVDFSVALLTDPAIVDTQLLDPVGSPLYMSPEQIREEPLTARSDLFSLGVVLYELVTGVHPFAAETLAGLSHRILNEEPPPARSRNPAASQALDDFLARVLAKDPLARCETAMAFAVQLRAAFDPLRARDATRQARGRVAALKSLSFFREFTEPDIWELLRWANWEDHESEEAIITEGESGNSVYIIVDGTVRVCKDGRDIASLTRGQCFGEIGYLAHCERSASVVAATDVSLVKLNATLIDRASASCQVRFQKVFIRTLIDRLVETTRQLASRGAG